MTCRHSPGDRSCTTQFPRYEPSDTATTPDAAKYTVEAAEEVNGHLVMRVAYPNCASCAYEGHKIMVFVDVRMIDALRWRRIDPHFRERTSAQTEAPPPIARFPATAQGWQDALEYAKARNTVRIRRGP